MTKPSPAETSHRPLILVGLTHGIDHLIQYALPIAVLVSPFSLVEQTILLTIMTFMFGLGGLPAGWLADQIDSRLVIILYLACAVFGLILASLSIDFVFSVIAQIIIGFGISLYHPAGTALVARLYPAGQRAIRRIHQVQENTSSQLIRFYTLGERRRL